MNPVICSYEISDEAAGGGGGGEHITLLGPKRDPRRQTILRTSRQLPRACGGFLRPDLLRPPSEHSESPPGTAPPSPARGSDAKRGRHLPDSPISGLSGAHQLEVFTNSSLNEYLNALSKNFSGQHIDIFFSEKQDLTQTGGSPPRTGCGCKEFYSAPGV